MTCVPAAGTPGAVSFGWTRDSIVLGAGAGYKLTAADLGKRATCVVTAVRAGYVDAVNQASSVTVVAAAPVRVTGLKPRVVGKMVERSTVTAQAGTVVPSTAVRTYQWLADGKKIKGATGRTFTLRKAQAGHQVSVRVTARAGAVSATATSPARRVGSSVKRLVVVRQVASGKKLTVTATGLTRGRRYVIWLGGQQRAAGVVGATGTVSRSVSFDPRSSPAPAGSGSRPTPRTAPAPPPSTAPSTTSEVDKGPEPQGSGPLRVAVSQLVSEMICGTVRTAT
ncbi:hypothetical protein [Aeromicrobium sp. UC242_57]|uniref:hypothetical protein n=1 Tax=Aeromicrobium sp. UC242_57 TaxID=3374624 RepID=UPI0037C110CF